MVELSRNLRVDSVARLGPTPPHRLDAARPVADAVAALREANVGCLLVTHKEKLVGIFTERDLLARVLAAGLPLRTPVRECMTSPVVKVLLKESVGAALRKMQEGGYRHLPVVDLEDRPVGILSAKRIVRYLVEHFPGTVYNQPPDPTGHYPATAEGA